MTVAQRHFPTDPSQCVEYGAGQSLLAGEKFHDDEDEPQ